MVEYLEKYASFWLTKNMWVQLLLKMYLTQLQSRLSPPLKGKEGMTKISNCKISCLFYIWILCEILVEVHSACLIPKIKCFRDIDSLKSSIFNFMTIYKGKMHQENLHENSRGLTG